RTPAPDRGVGAESSRRGEFPVSDDRATARGPARCRSGDSRGVEAAEDPEATPERGDLPFTWTLGSNSTTAGRATGGLPGRGALHERAALLKWGLYGRSRILSTREKSESGRQGPPARASRRRPVPPLQTPAPMGVFWSLVVDGASCRGGQARFVA